MIVVALIDQSRYGRGQNQQQGNSFQKTHDGKVSFRENVYNGSQLPQARKSCTEHKLYLLNMIIRNQTVRKTFLSKGNSVEFPFD